MPSYAADRPWPGASNWSDPLSRDALHALARASRRMVGFEIAVVNVVHRDRFRTVAVAGDDDARDVLMDSELDTTILLFELTRADRWGRRFRFVPAERAGRGRAWGWTPTIDKRLEPNAWDEEDLLMAPLLDSEGEMIGMLCVDAAITGLRPGPEVFPALDEYAEQVELALRVALDRDEVAERERLAGVVLSTVRVAASAVSVPGLWTDCEPSLLRGLSAREMWVHQLLGEERLSSTHPLRGVPALENASRELAQKLWAGQRVLTRGLGKPSPEYAALEGGDDLTGALSAHDHERLMIVPLGSGEECLGLLTLVRERGDAPWSSTEQHMAMRLGHDLGHAIRTAWASEQREELVARLRDSNESKENLVATLTHELKGPITVLRAHVENLEDGGAARMAQALGPMGRAVDRLTSMVDDLLLLTRLRSSDVAPSALAPVDLTEIASQAIAEYSDIAAVHGLRLLLEAEEDPDSWWALASADDLRVVLSNLVSNAIKYTPRDGDVRVRVRRTDPEHVVLECADDGIGIASGDLASLFDEFVRSEDPRARAQPGAGLGLSIVQRLVHLSDGRIEVDSELDAGSVFRVVLPWTELRPTG